MSVHTSHIVRGGAHPPPPKHVPLLHVCPPAQALPHDPQLLVSLERSAQVEPHITRGDPQVELLRQLPLTQFWPVTQRFPHDPQWSPLALVSTHAPLHIVCGIAHATTCTSSVTIVPRSSTLASAGAM